MGWATSQEPLEGQGPHSLGTAAGGREVFVSLDGKEGSLQ